MINNPFLGDIHIVTNHGSTFPCCQTLIMTFTGLSVAKKTKRFTAADVLVCLIGFIV